MVQEQVNIARIGTLADGSIRLSVDILGGSGETFKDLFDLKTEEITMILCKTSDLKEAI